MLQLEDIYRDAERQRQLSLDRLKAPAPDFSPTAAIAPTRGQQGLLGSLGYNPALNTHARQYEHNSGWVHACVRAIAQRIAGQEVRVGRWKGSLPAPQGSQPTARQLPKSLKGYADKLTIIENHPFLQVIDDPNAFMVRWVLLFVTAASLELTGKAFWWLFNERRDRKGRWTILPMPASWVQPKHSDSSLYNEWEILPNGAAGAQPITVSGDEVAYLYYPDPANPLGALSPLQAQSRAVVADEAMQEAQRRSFAQGLWPGVAVTVGRNPDVNGQQGSRPVLDPHQRAQIISAVKNAYRGVANFDEPIILDGLIENVARISNSPREMDFTQSGRATKGRITQGFGVNPIVLGEIEGANRASSAAAEEHFCSSTINPKIELISQCLTAWVAPLFAQPGERLAVWLEPAHASDPDLEMSEEKTLLGGYALTVNELRARHGLAAVKGGEVIWMPQTVVPWDPSVNPLEEAKKKAEESRAQATEQAQQAQEQGDQGQGEQQPTEGE